MSIFTDWPGGLIGLLLTVLFGAVGLILLGYLGRLALELAAHVLDRPLRVRDKLVMAAVIPLVLLLVWRLSFRQVSYGTVAAFLFVGAWLWTRNLLRGETWLSPQESRFNSEYIGPATLLMIAVLMAWNAVSPFI